MFTFTNALPCDPPWPPQWLPWPGLDRVGSPSTWLVKTAPSQCFSTRSERWKCAMRPPRPPRCTGATLRAFLRRTRLDPAPPTAHATKGRPNTLPQVPSLQHLLRCPSPHQHGGADWVDVSAHGEGRSIGRVLRCHCNGGRADDSGARPSAVLAVETRAELTIPCLVVACRLGAPRWSTNQSLGYLFSRPG